MKSIEGVEATLRASMEQAVAYRWTIVQRVTVSHAWLDKKCCAIGSLPGVHTLHDAEHLLECSQEEIIAIVSGFDGCEEGFDQRNSHWRDLGVRLRLYAQERGWLALAGAEEEE